MENYSIILFILAIMLGLSAIAERVKLPYPILLVIAGIGVGFLPGVPKIELDPEIIFLLFLPPMLYDAAFNISVIEFKRNIHTIMTLAFALVFFTAAGIAVLVHYLIPGMSWELSFTLGAILSATDAVAAMSITKGLGISHKTMTILEGESLINDASGLIAYRLAVAAITGSSFILWKAGLQFFILILGGFLVGLVLGLLLILILKYTHHKGNVAISFTLLMPFIAYLLAEELHVSGVIAVVQVGILISRASRRQAAGGLRVAYKSIWDIIVFILNGLIFVLIGFTFPYVIENIDHNLILPLIGYSFLICFVALIIRMARIFLQRVNLERAFKRKSIRSNKRALLNWKECLIIGWSGMRGIVSLATALALPMTLSDGSAFPQRNIIIFISVMVVLITLVVQGLSLPWLVRLLKVNPKHS
ncbi:monovalent cation:H+ antiporter, CPA1 family [Chitinophaga sp. CF118]|uniref:Na+/H+ antiporter n=1 Tax=Chitinophaga sp. CF118 TaxID=1884367 RepID=UPI0008E8CCD8|nr:Na+/H+ antiporter [Chitinophaga sp. CF118]SFD75698.1 monovalent cation:H+ antiporter, CPA1 family [Chitinophaga sp. CF118]